METQEHRWRISLGIEAALLEGTMRKISSAYLMKEFPGMMGCRSEAFKMKAEGPKAEPLITVAEMKEGSEVEPWNLV